MAEPVPAEEISREERVNMTALDFSLATFAGVPDAGTDAILSRAGRFRTFIESGQTGVRS